MKKIITIAFLVCTLIPALSIAGGGKKLSKEERAAEAAAEKAAEEEQDRIRTTLVEGTYFNVEPYREVEVVSQNDKKVEYTSKATHEELIEFYREFTKDNEHIKFRDWADATYIEDDGALMWHSITIDKHQKNGLTTVVVMKDNFSWIIGTLILRYIGVFAVLITLLIGMSISGAIISRSIARMEAKQAAAGGDTAEAEVAAAIAAGWSVFDLGERILRIETAALAIAALVALSTPKQ